MDSIGIQVASQNQTVDDHFHNSNGRKGAWLWPTPTQDWYRRSIMWNFFGMGLVTGCYKDSLDGWISKTTANLVLTPRLQELWPMDTNCFLSPPRTRGLFRLILIRCHFFRAKLVPGNTWESHLAGTWGHMKNTYGYYDCYNYYYYYSYYYYY